MRARRAKALRGERDFTGSSGEKEVAFTQVRLLLAAPSPAAADLQPRRYAHIQQFGHLVIPRRGFMSMIRCAAMPMESDLYAPVKALLEGQGYVVKGEVRGCDVVGVRGEEPPVIVELKRVFGLSLVLQGVDRLALSDRVYLAVGQWPKR